MIILQIEHPVPNYDGWKKAFESDPLNRKASGVKTYRILRPTDKPNNVIIELEFEELTQAEDMLNRLKGLWSKVEGTVMMNPQTRIIELTESQNL